MVDFTAVGRTGTPFRLDLERGKIREFARATRSDNPAYWRDERPVVPPTFLTTQMFWQEWAGPDADPWHHVRLDQRRGMHAEQEYVFAGPPPRAGTTLTGLSRIGEIYQKAGRRGGTLTFATMVTEFRDPDGGLVAEARMTGVETARPPQDDGRASLSQGTDTPAPVPAASPQAASSQAASSQAAAQALAPASGPEPGPWSSPPPPPPLVVGPLTRTDFVRYQGASGDMNPLHHDEPFAQRAGYEAPLAIGMFNAGLLATYATDWLGAVAVRGFRIRFREQAWPGDILTCTGLVLREYEADGEPRVDVELACVRRAGGVAVQAWATFTRENA